MKVNEFRIGNLVKNQDEEGTPHVLTLEDFGNPPWVTLYEPIRLTSDWMEKLGFVVDEFGMEKDWLMWLYCHKKLTPNTYIRFSPLKTIGIYAIAYHGCFSHYLSLVKFEFVHQLQNWFFCYSGKELNSI